MLEWNEALDRARESAPLSRERAALVEVESGLREQRAAALAHLAGSLCPLPERASPALVRARTELNALRYIEKTLADIDNLRLEQASSR